MQCTSRSAALALLIVVAVPSAALAAGGPVPPSQSTTIGSPGSLSRYGAFGAGHATIIKRLGADNVPTGARLRVTGRFGIPGVALNGSTTGLSANGRTLILAGIPRLGAVPRTSPLLVVNTPRLTVRARITLPGWSTVDAISPNGRWLYLIHYPSADISRYEVRAYDLLRDRMLAKPVVDPHDRGEPMTGFPITRVMSGNARWAYTLYFRPSGAPFIHALDTVGRRAVCVDLPPVSNLDVGNAHLSLTSGGRRLRVDIGGVTRAVVDTRTLAVVTHGAAAPRSASAPASAPARPAAHKSAARHSGSVPWALLAGLLAALAALAMGVVRRMRPRRGPTSPTEMAPRRT